MACRRNLFENFGKVRRVLADRKENAGRAFLRQRLQDRGRIDRPGAIVERQHHFLVAKKIELLEMLETEPWPAGGIDFNDPGDPDRVRICTGGLCRARRGRSRRGRRLRGCRALGSRGLRPCCA